MNASLPAESELVCWLVDDVVVILGTAQHASPAELSGHILVGDRLLPVEAAVMQLPWFTDASSPARSHGYLLAAVVPPVERATASILDVHAGRFSRQWTLSDLRARAMPLQHVLRRTLAPLDARTRSSVVQFLCQAPLRSSQRAASLCEALHRVREALRERLPTHPVSPEDPVNLHVDSLLSVGERAFYVKGWTHDSGVGLERLTAVSPDGQRAELLPRLLRYPRADVAQFYSAVAPDLSSGFVCFFEVQQPSLLASGWVFELETADGGLREVGGPRVLRDPPRVQRVILDDLLQHPSEADDMFRKHTLPALGLLTGTESQGPDIRRVVQYGSPPPVPAVTVIVPLYKRIDLVELQLATFADDPEVGGADVLFVLDSPELEYQLLEFCHQLEQVYRLPFRVAVLNKHSGFAAANNAGASLARGRLLLLLNSDVTSVRPGWLGAMTKFYDQSPGIGALGPKLLFDDDSLQHAGVYFRRPTGSMIWENAHYFKGLHSSLPAANVTRPVPAVTGACLMIARALYERVGGLSSRYLQGDYEDSDLCLRLHEAGFTNWYFADVELYHLEGQSYELEARLRNARYNTCLHTHLWGDVIGEVMTQHHPTSP